MGHQIISLAQVAGRQPEREGAATCGKPVAARCGLPLAQAAACGAARHREEREPDSQVIANATQSRDLWLVRSGILRLQRYAPDGRRQILSLFFPGEIVGFDREFRGDVSVETVTQSGLCRIDRRRFEALLDRDDTLRADFFRQKRDQLDRLHWLTWSLGALGPEERLCALLAFATKVMPYQRLPDGSGVLSMQLPRKDIADLLGTTVETVSRIVHKLSETGFIEIRTPAHFRILDLQELIGLGQIDGLFDRITQGLVRRRDQIEVSVGPAVGDPICVCG